MHRAVSKRMLSWMIYKLEDINTEDGREKTALRGL